MGETLLRQVPFFIIDRLVSIRVIVRVAHNVLDVDVFDAAEF